MHNYFSQRNLISSIFIISINSFEEILNIHTHPSCSYSIKTIIKNCTIVSFTCGNLSLLSTFILSLNIIDSEKDDVGRTKRISKQYC